MTIRKYFKRNAVRSINYWLGVHGVLVIILLSSGCKKKPAPSPPPEVQIIILAPTNVPIFEEWVGTLEGFVNAQIQGQVTGYLLTQNYIEGSEVKKGDLLFQIDPRPFQAALDQAQARLAEDQARSVKTELDVKRFTPLAQEQAISQEQLDDAVQANLAAKAQVKADEATAENARLNLNYTRIRSPIDGLAGTARAQIGDLVGQSGGVLTTVSTINPIKVYFQVNEQSYLTFWRHLIGLTNADETFPLQIILSDGSVYPEKGKFFYADRQIDPNTGTLQIFGLFPNEQFILRPGQYGRVRAQTQTILETSSAEALMDASAATIPELEQQIALQENQLSILLGQNPGTIPHANSSLENQMPPKIPAGLPSALLERRPDIREAEQQLRSANAEVGAAKANFFPQLNLTGLFGEVSPELSAFTSDGGVAWGIAAGLTGPLFHGGELRAQYAQARATREQFDFQYRAAVLNAFQEVSNALISRDKSAIAGSQQSRAVEAYKIAVKISMERYRMGSADYYEVLQEQQLLFPAEDTFVQFQLNQLLAIVQLYRALGGGWEK